MASAPQRLTKWRGGVWATVVDRSQSLAWPKDATLWEGFLARIVPRWIFLTLTHAGTTTVRAGAFIRLGKNHAGCLALRPPSEAQPKDLQTLSEHLQLPGYLLGPYLWCGHAGALWGDSSLWRCPLDPTHAVSPEPPGLTLWTGANNRGMEAHSSDRQTESLSYLIDF